MGVDPGPDRGPANRKFRQCGAARRDPPDAVVDLGLIPGELLAEADRGRVHQVRASRFHDRIELLSFLGETLFEFPEGGQEALIDLQERRDVDRRRDDIVRGLAHVGVVVRMDRPFLAERMAEDFVGPVRDDLVPVHVRRRPAARLEHVEGELGVELAVHHFLAGLDDRLPDLGIKQAELHVRLGRCHLDEPERVDEAAPEADPANGEVLDRSLGLRPPVRVFRDLELPQEVPLDAIVRHPMRRRRQNGGSINLVNGAYVSTEVSGREGRIDAEGSAGGVGLRLLHPCQRRHRTLGRPSFDR